MYKKQSIMLAVTGILLAAASQASAQNTYNNEDLLLNFRNYTTQTDPNVTIDLGNVNSFVSSVQALPGGTAVLDSGTGFTASFSTGFSYADLTGLLGAPSAGNEIGFSAAAADGTGGTGLLYLTRKQTSPGVPPTFPSGQQPLTAQAATASAIALIGQETTTGTTLPDSGANSVSYSSGDPDSYQQQAQDPANSFTIDYGGSQLTTTGQGGKIELQQNGAGDLYEALWEVPTTDSGNSDTYEGYFTFQPDGEIDFTTTTVPEPSTYALLVVTGTLAFAFRRRIRRLIA
jgi:PEP-CTERM motif